MADRDLLEENALLKDRIRELERSESVLRQAEEALRSSETRFRMLHRSMIDAFVTVDMQGRILESNESFLRMLGYSSEEIGGLTYEDITPEKWHAMERAIVEEEVLNRGYSEVYEKEYRRKDGTVFPVELRTTLLRDGEGTPSIMWAIVRDITGRKRMEDALRSSEEQYRTLVDKMQDAVFRSDLKGNLTFTTPSAARILGYSSAEVMIGLNIGNHFYHDPEEARRHGKMLLEKGILTQYEATLKRADTGQLVSVLANSQFFRDREGNFIGIEGGYSDITDRRRAEATLLESEEKFSRVFRMSPDIMTITRLSDSIYIDVNDEFTRQTGYAREEAIGKTPLTLPCGSMLRTANAYWKACLPMKS
jgi:PAS domain S-box-containing protein